MLKLDRDGRGDLHPRIVRQMLTNRSNPQPATIATPTGGNRMVIRTIRRAGAPSLMFAVVMSECE